MQIHLSALLLLLAGTLGVQAQAPSLTTHTMHQEVTLNKPWDPQYNNISSAAYNKLKTDIQTALTALYSTVTYFTGIQINGIRPSNYYVSFGYNVMLTTQQGQNYSQSQILQIMTQISTTGLTIGGIFYSSSSNCNPRCQNSGACYQGKCYCTTDYTGSYCETPINAPTVYMKSGEIALKMKWMTAYDDRASFNFYTLNQSLTTALSGEFNYINGFKKVILRELERMTAMTRRKRQTTVQNMVDVKIMYDVFFNKQLSSSENAEVDAKMMTIKKSGLMVNNKRIYPAGHTGCVDHLSCNSGYCSEGRCMCVSGYTGERCEKAVGSATSKPGSLNLTMPFVNNFVRNSAEYLLLKQQLQEALHKRFMNLLSYSQVMVVSISMSQTSRQRRQAQAQDRNFLIHYEVQFTAVPNGMDVTRVMEDLKKNGLVVNGVHRYPPGRTVLAMCMNGMLDINAVTKIAQKCLQPLALMNITLVPPDFVCRLYYGGLLCARRVMRSLGYNCTFTDLHNSVLVKQSMQAINLACSGPLPSDIHQIESMCENRQMLAAYSMSTICISYTEIGPPCRYLVNASQCIDRYTSCGKNNITQALIDHPNIVRSRYSYDFSTCNRPSGCTSDSQCANGGSCVGNMCSCAPGYTGTYCYTSVTSYTCTYDSQCANGGSCVGNMCSCAPGYTGTYCYTSVTSYNKTGNCPIVPPNQSGICMTECSNDGGCTGNLKCCYNGCAYTCQAPVFNTSYFRFNSSVKLNMAWRIDLTNPQSPFYSEVKMAMEMLLGQHYSRNLPVHSVMVTGFSPGSVIVKYLVLFLKDVQFMSQELKMAKATLENTTLSLSSGSYNFIRTVNKPGMCPPQSSFGICQDACLGDDACSGNQKCCFNGCGRVCLAPRNDTSCATQCKNGGSCLGSYCWCPQGYSGVYCEQQVEYNSTCSECGVAGMCMRFAGQRTRCICPYEYTGTYCETYVPNNNSTNSVSLILTLNVDWMPQYNTSYQWRQQIRDALKTYFSDMPYFLDLTVDKLMPGSTVVFFTLTFSNQPPSDSEILARMERIHNNGIQITDMVFTTIRTNDCRNFNKRCVNGGSCLRQFNGQYQCDCPVYYYGESCEWLDYSDCRAWKNSCVQGYCSQEYKRTKHTCKCYAGWTGDKCNQQGNTSRPCDAMPCTNGGSCINRYWGTSSSNYSCICPATYRGRNCEKTFCDLLPINPCTKYGGECMADFDNGQLCRCPTAMYNGKYISGFFCDVLGNVPDSQISVCEKIRNQSDVTRALLQGKLPMIGIANVPSVLREAMKMFNLRTVFRPECDGSGVIKKGCSYNIESPDNEKCFCTDARGYQLPQRPVSYNELPVYCPERNATCFDYTCQYNSSCYYASDRSYCGCPPGYSGKYCEIYMGTPCDKSPCQNNFSCVSNLDGSYKCKCPEEWGVNCENVPYWYCNCGSMQICVREEVCSNGPCKRRNKCVPYDYQGPCSANPCNGRGMCVEQEGGMHTCECYSGYSGSSCEQNAEVCKIVEPLNVCGIGTCLGDIEGGQLCKCPKGRRGAFCNKTGDAVSKCERQSDLYNTAWAILNGQLTIPNIPNVKNIVKNLTMTFMKTTEIPMTKCTASGDYAPQQCVRDMITRSERCYCVNSMGMQVNFNVTMIPGQPPCTVPDPGDIAKMICGSPLNLCLNGGTCVGELLDKTPQLCECANGYEGILCERVSQTGEKPKDYSMCTFALDSFNMLQSIMKGNLNLTLGGLTLTGQTLIQTYYQLFMSGAMKMMNNMTTGMTIFNTTLGPDMAVIKPNCTKSGDFAPVQCEYSMKSGRRHVCHCYTSVGKVIPGTRTPAPKWPDCSRTDKACPLFLCPLTCEYGYRKDMTGCHICQCKKMCEGKLCPHGMRCVRGYNGREECKQTHKQGMCAKEAMADTASLIKLFQDTQDTCDIRCHDDADCDGDMKCCGACGNKCVRPYFPRNCAMKKEIMDQHWELYQNMSVLLRDSYSQLMTMANRTYPAVMHSAINWIKTTKKIWRPSCNTTGDYARVQCEFDTKTKQKVNCFCADYEGKRINGTDSMQPRCTEKPGSCPRYMPVDVMPETTDQCRRECEDDFDCSGNDKCCMVGCHSTCKKPFNDTMIHPGSNLTDLFKKMCGMITTAKYCDHGSTCVGNWKTGDLCGCSSGYKGPLCKEMIKPGERPPTVCEKRRELMKLASNQDYAAMRNMIIESMQIKSLIVPYANCTKEGMFRPVQCDFDLKTGLRKFCYCVNETGQLLNGTMVRSPYRPTCDAATCDIGNMFYRPGGENKPVMCSMRDNNCPYGYKCKMVSGRSVCCVSHEGIQDVCRQAPSAGKWCSSDKQSYQTKFYFNVTLDKCMPYQFRGCHGNDNTFATLENCTRRCVHKEKPGTCPKVPPSSGNTNCRNECENDFMCPRQMKCCQTGCGRKCRPTEGPTVNVCHLPKVVGPCRASISRFFFNKTNGKCEHFSYGGCGGNGNNFESLEDCCSECGDKNSQCKSGECPAVSKDYFSLCANLCNSDADCRGDLQCCSNGCGRTCLAPTRYETKTCHTVQRQVHMKLKMKPDNCNQDYIPRCNKDGTWKPLQCIDSLGLCWCADRKGRQIGNITRGYTKCSSLPMVNPDTTAGNNYGQMMKGMKICESGQKTHCCNPSLCQLHMCRAYPSAVCRINPCDGCKAEFFNHNNEKVDCDDGYSGCALAYNAAKKRMKEIILNKMLAKQRNVTSMMTINITEIVRQYTMIKPVPAPDTLPSKCRLPADPGRCRGADQKWFFNHTSNRCDKFIYGTCDGNENRFDTAEECYKECNENASPCKSSNKCLSTQKCTLGIDYACERGPCAIWAECSYTSKDPLLSGIPIPMCNYNTYLTRQCHNEYCWCVKENGERVEGSLAKRYGVQCNTDGSFVIENGMGVSCPNNKNANLKCIDTCMNKVCPGKPNAMCVVNLCSTNCKTKFMEGDKEVKCSSDVCSVVQADVQGKCEVKYGCEPKYCTDACANERCSGNPCAKCVTDPCTCKAKFVDILTNKTVTNCNKFTHTPCEVDLCQKKMQKYKEMTMMGMSSVVLPKCSASGRYLPEQCDDKKCWCVDGKGQKLVLDSTELNCYRNEIVKVVITFKFNEDFSLVSNDIQGFKDELLKSMRKLMMIEGGERFITEIVVTRGSIVVTTTVEDTSNPANPSPYVSLIGDILQNSVQNGNMKVNFNGTEFVADSGTVSRHDRFEDTSPPTTPKPRPTGLALPVIIAIAVGAGIVGVLLFAVIIYCCCCRDDRSSRGSQSTEEYTPDTKPDPMMIGHTNATYGMVNKQPMDNMAYLPNDDVIKVRL